MRIARFIAASTIGLSLGTGLSSACLAATITATADNRSGSISAFDGSGDPVQDGFNVTPGGNDFDSSASFSSTALDVAIALAPVASEIAMPEAGCPLKRPMKSRPLSRL